MLPSMRNTCTAVPVVNTWVTLPLPGSTLAAASRTFRPVILSTSFAASRQNFRISCWWYSRRFAAPFALLANSCSARREHFMKRKDQRVFAHMTVTFDGARPVCFVWKFARLGQLFSYG